MTDSPSRTVEEVFSHLDKEAFISLSLCFFSSNLLCIFKCINEKKYDLCQTF